MEKLLAENIILFEKIITKTDEINKRLVTTVIVAIVAFSLTIFGITWLYFKTDYEYPSVNQTNSVDIKGGIE